MTTLTTKPNKFSIIETILAATRVIHPRVLGTSPLAVQLLTQLAVPRKFASVSLVTPSLLKPLPPTTPTNVVILPGSAPTSFDTSVTIEGITVVTRSETTVIRTTIEFATVRVSEIPCSPSLSPTPPERSPPKYSLSYSTIGPTRHVSISFTTTGTVVVSSPSYTFVKFLNSHSVKKNSTSIVNAINITIFTSTRRGYLLCFGREPRPVFPLVPTLTPDPPLVPLALLTGPNLFHPWPQPTRYFPNTTLSLLLASLFTPSANGPNLLLPIIHVLNLAPVLLTLPPTFGRKTQLRPRNGSLFLLTTNGSTF